MLILHIYGTSRRCCVPVCPHNREPGHCQLTTAVSPSSPLGPYIYNRTVLRSSAIDGPTNGSISHNVQPVLGPDGAIYIFMITSNPHPTYPGVGSHGPEEHDMRTPSQAENSTVSKPKPKPKLSVMVGRASHLGAAFEWVTPLLLQADGQAVLKDNPTAIVFGNGTVLMATRGTALFRADSWRGPYHMLSASIIPNETLPNRNPRSTKTEGTSVARMPPTLPSP